jgi:hypothetical protein
MREGENEKGRTGAENERDENERGVCRASIKRTGG